MSGSSSVRIGVAIDGSIYHVVQIFAFVCRPRRNVAIGSRLFIVECSFACLRK